MYIDCVIASSLPGWIIINFDIFDIHALHDYKTSIPPISEYVTHFRLQTLDKQRLSVVNRGAKGKNPGSQGEGRG